MERRLAAVMAADMVGYSRLMERDESGVLERQKRYRRELIDPEIKRNGGRIVKTTGDGMLVEFSSALDAVRCSLDIQTSMDNSEGDVDQDDRIIYRVGINLGDIIFEEDDIFGDGVNVAARLEGLAEPGGVCVSDSVYQSVADRMAVPFRDMGSQRVKNLKRPIRVWQWTVAANTQQARPETSLQQRVKFCRSADGTHIAWASIGKGPVVMKAPNWLNHIEYEWDNPIWAPFLGAFAERAELIRFDQRGTGLSDWEPPEITPDTMIADMEAIAEASGADRFALFGLSQGAAFSVEYALRHPEKVSCLILAGGYLRGRSKRHNPEQDALFRHAMNMIQDGWGSTNPLFRQFFVSSFIPEAKTEEQAAFDELQRVSTNMENASTIFEMNADIDIVEKARQLDVPTLVLHIKGDLVAPIEEGRLIARTIPGAQFMELPGDNHVFLDGTPAFDLFFEELTAFLARHA